MEQKDRFLGMLLCTLGANVLRNMLINKGGGGGAAATSQGREVISTGKRATATR